MGFEESGIHDDLPALSSEGLLKGFEFILDANTSGRRGWIIFFYFFFNRRAPKFRWEGERKKDLDLTTSDHHLTRFGVILIKYKYRFLDSFLGDFYFQLFLFFFFCRGQPIGSDCLPFSSFICNQRQINLFLSSGHWSMETPRHTHLREKKRRGGGRVGEDCTIFRFFDFFFCGFLPLMNQGLRGHSLSEAAIASFWFWFALTIWFSSRAPEITYHMRCHFGRIGKWKRDEKRGRGGVGWGKERKDVFGKFSKTPVSTFLEFVSAVISLRALPLIFPAKLCFKARIETSVFFAPQQPNLVLSNKITHAGRTRRSHLWWVFLALGPLRWGLQTSLLANVRGSMFRIDFATLEQRGNHEGRGGREREGGDWGVVKPPLTRIPRSILVLFIALWLFRSF